MKTMVFISLLRLCFSASEAQNSAKSFLSGNAVFATVYAFNLNLKSMEEPAYPIILKNGKLVGTISDSVRGNWQRINVLLKYVTKRTDTRRFIHECYEPKNAIVFFNKDSVAVDYIEFDFSCNEYRLSKDEFKLSKEGYGKFKDYIKSSGLLKQE
jgi:hypothetical protein